MKLFNAAILCILSAATVAVGMKLEDMEDTMFSLSNSVHCKQVVETDTSLYSNVQVLRLAQALYWEGMDESYEAKVAIANTIKNRMKTGRWGDSYIDVIDSGCQYNFTCMKLGTIQNEQQWQEAMEAAIAVYSGEVEDNTYGAEYYMNTKTASKQGKSFFKKLIKTVKIGKHTFYKERK